MTLGVALEVLKRDNLKAALAQEGEYIDEVGSARIAWHECVLHDDVPGSLKRPRPALKHFQFRALNIELENVGGTNGLGCQHIIKRRDRHGLAAARSEIHVGPAFDPMLADW